MHLDDVLASRTRVEQVDVLRHHRLDEPAPLELRECLVRCVRLRVAKHVEPLAIEAPHALGIPLERAERRNLEGIDLRPDSGFGAEVGDPRLRRDAGTREHDARLPLADEGC